MRTKQETKVRREALTVRQEETDACHRVQKKPRSLKKLNTTPSICGSSVIRRAAHDTTAAEDSLRTLVTKIHALYPACLDSSSLGHTEEQDTATRQGIHTKSRLQGTD